MTATRTELVDTTYTNTTRCACTRCPNCHTPAWGIDLCDTCDILTEPSDCFEGNPHVLRDRFTAWLDANDSPCGIAVMSTNLTWGRPGTWMSLVPTDTLRDLDNPTDLAAVTDEWRQQWTVSPHPGGVCRIVVFHSDARDGAPVELRPMIGCLNEDGQF